MHFTSNNNAKEYNDSNLLDNIYQDHTHAHENCIDSHISETNCFGPIINKAAVLDEFWAKEISKAQSSTINFKNAKLPLARIKRLMKVEEDVKVIAQEVPVLFAFVTEKFVEELTLRAWLHTKEGKRKILQGSDVYKAVKTCGSLDFLNQIILENEAAELQKQKECKK